MEKEYYMNAGIPAQGLSEPGMQPWNSFSLPQELNSNSQFISSFLLNSHWEKEIDHFTQFQSTLGPVALPTSSVVDDAVGIREFIAKLGPIRNSGCADTNGWNAKQQGVPIFNEFVKRNSPNIANSLLLDPPLPALSTDPEFAERAAKFSCFGSHSFNVKRNHSTLTDVESPHRSNSAMARVWSSPSLKQDGSPIENRESCQTQMEIKKFDRLPSIGPNSNDCSSISEQVPSGDTVSKVPNEIHSRKRKTVPKSKAKENISPTVDSHQVGEADDAKNEKRPKIAAETSPNEIGNINREEEEKKKAKDGVNEALNEQHKPDMVTQKSTEPQKDYIHVRARRGQATDSHSLAERVRREKIGERMKLLQDLVPGCNKVTGKALMLDEIINYVQSLQCQVEFLSMKLASVDSRQEVNVDNFSSKDVVQRNGSFYPVESTIPGSYAHQQKQYPQMHNDSSLNQCPVEPLIKTPSHNLEVRLPSLNEFVDCLPQFPAFCEEDLHSIVGMGYGQNAVKESDFIQ